MDVSHCFHSIAQTSKKKLETDEASFAKCCLERLAGILNLPSRRAECQLAGVERIGEQNRFKGHILMKCMATFESAVDLTCGNPSEHLAVGFWGSATIGPNSLKLFWHVHVRSFSCRLGSGGCIHIPFCIFNGRHAMVCNRNQSFFDQYASFRTEGQGKASWGNPRDHSDKLHKKLTGGLPCGGTVYGYNVTF